MVHGANDDVVSVPLLVASPTLTGSWLTKARDLGWTTSKGYFLLLTWAKPTTYRAKFSKAATWSLRATYGLFCLYPARGAAGLLLKVQSIAHGLGPEISVVGSSRTKHRKRTPLTWVHDALTAYVTD